MEKVLKMRVKDFVLSMWSILVISLPIVICSDWKPIVPPADYYVTKPPTCAPDCDIKIKYLLESAGDGGAETQLKSTVLNQHLNSNQDKDFQQSNQKLDLEVPFFPKDNAFHTLPNYEDVLRKTPTSFFAFKTYAPQKPTKTLYYGDLELAKPKLPDEGKFFKGYKPVLGEEIKILKPSNFIENEVKSYRPIKGNPFEDQCTLYKVSFQQDLYYQYIQYKVHMPDLKEFTICLWTRLHNHSHEHSLFSYAAKPHRKGIYMWINNLHEPGLFNMKILGQTIFRLNYPFVLYKWYHTCQSWNGNTGEWQVWVNSHRIARGFHNLLVGHRIPGGGLAISGQEQRFFGKGFQEIPNYLKGSGGLEGEITMLQLYKVALTPGKAYNDHSHHHSHYTTTTPEPPELPSEEPSTTTDHPFLENGQLKKNINVLELAEALRNKGHIELPEKYEHQPTFEIYGKPLIHQPYVSHISPLAIHGNTLHYLGLPNHAIYKRNDGNEVKDNEQTTVITIEEQNKTPQRVKTVSNISGLVHVRKLKDAAKEDTEDDHLLEEVLEGFSVEEKLDKKVDNSTNEDYIESFTELYKEKGLQNDTDNGNSRVGRKRLRRHNPHSNIRLVTTRPKHVTIKETKPMRSPHYQIKKRGEMIEKEKETSKRHIIFGDPYIHLGLLDQEPQHHTYSDTPDFTLNNFSVLGPESGVSFDDNDESKLLEDGLALRPMKEEKKKVEVEVAQSEVKKILRLCSGCQPDPFRKVAVISWRLTPKKIYSGAVLIKAKPQCENF